MKPEMTECDRKLVTQPSLKMPTIVYRQPARNATCTVRDASQPRLAMGDLQWCLGSPYTAALPSHIMTSSVMECYVSHSLLLFRP